MRKVQDGPNEVDSSDENGGGAEGERRIGKRRKGSVRMRSDGERE